MQIKLYLDEDVDVLIARILKNQGYDIMTTTEANNLQASDEGQMSFAIGEQRTLFTHNARHFEKLYQQYLNLGRVHYGVIIATRRDPYELVRRIRGILNSLSAEDLINQIIYI